MKTPLLIVPIESGYLIIQHEVRTDPLDWTSGKAVAKIGSRYESHTLEKTVMSVVEDYLTTPEDAPDES